MIFESLKIPPAPQAPESEAQAIALAFSVPLWFAHLLWTRGHQTQEQVREFLEGPNNAIGNPWLLKGMEGAVETILAYRSSGRELCIFGDYDLDGISGAALLVHALRRAGGWKLSYRLPSRFGDGYGMSLGIVESIYESGARGIISVDTGITANREIARARELGMDVVIVDHHRPPDDGLPNATAILDPWQDGCTYPHKDLSAVGVAYKLACALYERIDLGGADDFLDLMALGTLSDMMPMNPENRQILRIALARMPKSVFPGVKVLCESVADSDGHLGTQDILFRVAPLMNAPGRLDKPDNALEMLLSLTEKEALRTIEKLRTANDKRREIEAEITREAMAQDESRVKDHRVLVVDSVGWHLGVLGIVASKLTQAFGRPSAVVSVSAEGVGSGSVRGVDGFDWHQALSDTRDQFDRWGGHKNAAGFSLQADRLEFVRQSFETSAINQGYEPGIAQPVVDCHAEVRLCDMNIASMELLRRLEPCGRGNPVPILVARKVKFPSGIREIRGGHLQFEVVQEEGIRFAAVAFGLGYSPDLLRKQVDGVDMTFVPSWNSYKGRRVLQLQIKAIAPCAHPIGHPREDGGLSCHSAPDPRLGGGDTGSNPVKDPCNSL
jgi:single-stranded-DNA-specific exonuclease